MYHKQQTLNFRFLQDTPSAEEIRRRLISTGAGDPDAVDIEIRIAFVQYLLSDCLLANLSEHTRTLRLYPRPVVAFQLYSFIKSRLRTPFVDRLAKTQAVEYFAEWVLSPTNLTFQRINSGQLEARVIGDKAKWLGDQLEKLQFRVYDDENGKALVEVLRDESASRHDAVGEV